MTNYGHNSGETLADGAKAEIDQALEPMKSRKDALAKSAEALIAGGGIKDRDLAQRATDLGGMYQQVMADIEAAHEKVKAPYLNAGRVVDAAKANLVDDVDEWKAKVDAELERWHIAERDRIAKKREAEREAFADDPEPSIALHERAKAKTTTRGGYGARSSLREQHVVEIVDVKKIPKRILERDGVLQAIKAAVRPLLIAGEAISGTKLSTVDRLSVTKG